MDIVNGREDELSRKQDFLCSYSELWDVGKVTPHPRNPNTHPDKQLALLAKIIEGHGWRAPITVSKRSGYVIRGHGRLAAAMLLGCEKVPVDLQEYANEAEEYADMIADNRIAELAEIDQEELNKLVADLEAEGYDMGRLGFSDRAIQEMLAAEAKGDIEEDDFDVDAALALDPICKPGDIWLLGEHRLMCGDSTDKVRVFDLMEGDKADMIWTDPPYNVDYQGGTKKKLKIKNDKMSPDEFYDFLHKAFVCMEANTKEGGAIYVCFADRESVNFRNAMTNAGFEIKQGLIWQKNVFVLGRQDYQWQHEPILYGWKPGKSHNFYGGRKLGTTLPADFPVSVAEDGEGFDLLTFHLGLQSVTIRCPEYEVVNTEGVSTSWFVPRPTANREHPTMKPIQLVAKAILNSSREGDIVLDLFGGSGSTLVACEGTHRKCRTMELDPKYCDVIIRRWEALTKKKAILKGQER